MIQVIQEVGTAQELILQYGQYAIPWQTFISAMLSTTAELLVPPDFRVVVNGLSSFRRREQASRVGSGRISLLQALFETMNSRATDPRDKVYALLGLTSDGAGIVPMPNYEQPCDDVYMQTTINIMIEQGKVGAILLAARQIRPPNSNERFPSWAPMWSALSDHELVPWIAKCVEYMKSMVDIPSTVIERKVLRLPCRISESIEAVLANSSNSASCTRWSSAFRSLDFHKFVSELYDAMSWRVSEDVENTRIINGISWPWKATTDERKKQKEINVFLDLLINRYPFEPALRASASIGHWMDSNGSLQLEKKTVQPILQAELIRKSSPLLHRWEGPSSTDAMAVARWLQIMDDRKMRIAVTTRDGCVRVVHENANVGDVIAHLPNCPMPVVLRKGYSRYKFIGEVWSLGFARLFKGFWGERDVEKSWPDPWGSGNSRIDPTKVIEIE